MLNDLKFRTFNLFLGGPLHSFTLLLPPVLGTASAISSDKLKDFLSAGSTSSKDTH